MSIGMAFDQAKRHLTLTLKKDNAKLTTKIEKLKTELALKKN